MSRAKLIITSLLSILVTSFLLYSAYRGLALAWQADNLHDTTWQDWLQSFIIGFRYDAFATTWLMMIPAVIIIFLSPWIKQIDKIIIFFLGSLQLLGLWLNLTDIEMIKIAGRRFEFADRFFAHESAFVLLQVITHYWFLVLVGTFSLPLFFFLSFQLNQFFKKILPLKTKLGLGSGIFVLLVLLLIGSRGGLQPKPLDYAHANFSQSIQLNAITMNSVFTIYQSLTKISLPMVQYMDDKRSQDLVEGSWIRPSVLNDGYRPAQAQNIVILIVESLSLEYMGYPFHDQGYTPFLDELAQRSLFFSKGISNARRSIDGVCAVLTGIPAWFEESFISSSAMNSDFGGVARLLKDKEYYSAFFHGGNNGTMFFDAFARRAGFNDYFGANEFADMKFHDGAWGIYDEPFLQYAVAKMNGFKTPFVSSIFTLSSHSPYKIPAEHKNEFRKGPLPIHETIGYTDYSLRKFFESAQKQKWYDNTLFIITADHAFFEPSRPSFKNVIGKARIPLIFFHPKVKLPQINQNEFVQQIDILPSILDYLGFSNMPHVLLGKSVFFKGPRSALYAANESQFWLFSGDYFLHFVLESVGFLYSWEDPLMHQKLIDHPDLRKNLEDQTQALLQFSAKAIATKKFLMTPQTANVQE